MLEGFYDGLLIAMTLAITAFAVFVVWRLFKGQQ
jgi:hypothetical protein